MIVTVKAAKTGSSKKNFVLGLPKSQKVFLWGSDASILFKFTFPFSLKNCEIFQGGSTWFLSFFHLVEQSSQVIGTNNILAGVVFPAGYYCFN